MLGPPAEEAEGESRGDGWRARVTEWVLIRNNQLESTFVTVLGRDNTDQDTNEDCVATGVGSVAGEGVGSDVVMETDADKPKFSKKYLDKVSQAWRNRGDKRKKKRLIHTRKDKW